MPLDQSTGADAGSVTSATLTFGKNVLAGSTLVAIVRYGSTTDNFTSISDTINGTWPAPVVNLLGSSPTCRLYVIILPNTLIGTPSVTVHFSVAASIRWIIGAASAVIRASVEDLASSSNHTSSSSPSQNTATTVAADYLMAIITTSNAGTGNTITKDASWVERIHVQSSGSGNNNLDVSDRVAGAPGAYSSTWTLGTADTSATAILALKSLVFFSAAGEGPDYDYPNPRSYIPPITNRTFVASFPLKLRGQDRFFAGPGKGPNYDWPNPRGYVRNVALLSWMDWFKLNLIGKDRFFGAAGQPPANLDQPVPRGYAKIGAIYTIAANLLQSTLSVIVFPFTLLDWPVPRSPAWGASLRSWLQELKLNLLGQDFFPAGADNYDWPNPRGYQWPIDVRAWIQNAYRFTGFDQFFGASGQPPLNSDQPNPRGYQWAVSLRTWLDALKLNLIGQDKFFGAPGQPAPNSDQPVPPRGYAWPIELRTWLQVVYRFTGLDQFFGAPGQPAANLDQPVPSRGYTWGIALRTWLQELKVNLLGQDQLFGAPGQPPTYDWPLPRRAAFPVWTWAVDLLQSTLAAIALPFAFYDWPNPRSLLGSVDRRTWVQSAYRFTGLDQFFAAPGQSPIYDYPNPRGPSQGITLRTIAINLLQSTLATIAIPFAFYDWPIPRSYALRVELLTWLQSAYRFTGFDQFFGAPGQPPLSDWPNPRAPSQSITLRTIALNLLQSTLAAIAIPFALYDWPVPRSASQPESLRTIAINLLQSTLSALMPFAFYDWPNPRGSAWIVSIRGWLQELKLNLVSQDQFFGAPGQPPANLDQPNPRGYTWPRAVLTWIVSLLRLSPPFVSNIIATDDTMSTPSSGADAVTLAMGAVDTVEVSTITSDMLVAPQSNEDIINQPSSSGDSIEP